MSYWAIIWLTLLGVTGISFVVMLITVSGGAVAELRQTLEELRQFREPPE